MENLDLVKSGKEAADILITYLAKDAMGADFLKDYLANANAINESTHSQQEALQKIVDGSSEIKEQAKGIAEKAMQNNERLNSIYDAIEKLGKSVERIEREHRLYAQQFTELITQAKEINSLVDSIKNISAQTNLLSFNASIEAARAGVAGKGFRIIANEVKKLSDDTDKTSETIKAKVDALTHSISSLEKETFKNTDDMSKLTQETESTLERFTNVRTINSENNMNVGGITEYIEQNIVDINDLIVKVRKAEEDNKKTLTKFAVCASENEMLFNDLYSFAYEIKAIFKELLK